jgi:phage terminase large subunit GpA-like protein
VTSASTSCPARTAHTNRRCASRRTATTWGASAASTAAGSRGIDTRRPIGSSRVRPSTPASPAAPRSRRSTRAGCSSAGGGSRQPDGRYPSFHLNALYSPFGSTTWQIIVEQWETAQGKPFDLKQFVNTILAQTWKELGDEVDPDLVADRVEPFPPESRVPAGVGVITAGTDVQGDRIERRVWGWGAGRESWLLRVDVIAGDPSSDAVWFQWDAIRREAFVHVSGRRMAVAREFVDAGDGYHTSKVYEVCRRRRSEGVYACKGIEGIGAPLVGKPTKQGSVRALLFPVGTFAAKELFLRSQIRETRRGPGYVHLPLASWCDKEEMLQLVAERLKREFVKGRGWVRSWDTTRERNEALDCRNYAAAALESLGVAVVRELGAFATLAATPLPPGAGAAAPIDEALLPQPPAEDEAPDPAELSAEQAASDVDADPSEDPPPPPPANSPTTSIFRGARRGRQIRGRGYQR